MVVSGVISSQVLINEAVYTLKSWHDDEVLSANPRAHLRLYLLSKQVDGYKLQLRDAKSLDLPGNEHKLHSLKSYSIAMF